MAALGLLVLRLTVAVVLVSHGVHMLFGTFGGAGLGPGGLADTAVRFRAIGLEPGYLLALLAGVIQLAGGILLAVGLLTRWAASAVLGYLAIGIWTDSARWGFFLNWVLDPTRGHGFEYAFTLAGAVGCLILAGGGDWSIDGRRASSAASRAAGRARLRDRT